MLPAHLVRGDEAFAAGDRGRRQSGARLPTATTTGRSNYWPRWTTTAWSWPSGRSPPRATRSPPSSSCYSTWTGVLTADALHTQPTTPARSSPPAATTCSSSREPAQPACAGQGSPWPKPPQRPHRETAHGRREIRRMKICTARPGPRLPPRRPGHPGQTPPHRPRAPARPPSSPSTYHQPATRPDHPCPARRLIRGHWSIEALHHIRDVTYREDASKVRTGTDPASWPACATWPSASRLIGWTNIAAALRNTGRDYHQPLPRPPRPHLTARKDLDHAMPTASGRGGPVSVCDGQSWLRARWGRCSL